MLQLQLETAVLLRSAITRNRTRPQWQPPSYVGITTSQELARAQASRRGIRPDVSRVKEMDGRGAGQRPRAFAANPGRGALPRPATATETARTLAGAPAGQDRGDRAEDDAQIETERPVVDVRHVGLDPVAEQGRAL